MNRVCVFIDGSDFYFALKRNNHATRVDYYELSKALVGPDRQLIRAYYYNASYDPSLSPDKWKGQQPFLDSLDKMPFLELRLGKLIPQTDGGFRETGVDVRLACDLVYYAAKNIYDTAIIITEGTEFSDAISKVKEFGKQVEMGFFPDGQPKELIRAADTIIPLKEVLEMFGNNIFPDISETTEDQLDNAGNKIWKNLVNQASSAIRKNKNV